MLRKSIQWCFRPIHSLCIASVLFYNTVAFADVPVADTREDTAPGGDPALPAMIGTTKVITAADLDRYGIRTAAEAIEFLSLGMSATQPLHASEVGARGVLLSGDGGGHVMIALDGHPLNEPWRGAAFVDRGLGIPLELIDRIEITLGPGAVRYGDHAVLGVMNVITKRATKYPGVHLFVESEFFKSIRAGAGAGVDFHLAKIPGEFVLEVDYFAQGGAGDVFGPQSYGMDSITGMPKRFTEQGEATGIWGGVQERTYSVRVPSVVGVIRWGDVELRARASSYFRDSPYLTPLAHLYSDEDDGNRNEVDEIVTLDLRYRRRLFNSWTVWGRLYGDFYGFARNSTSSALEDCFPNQTSGCRRLLNAKSRWGGLEAQAFYDWTKDKKHVLLLGLDLQGRRAESVLEVHDPAGGVADVDSIHKTGEYGNSNSLISLFVEQRSTPWDWLSLYAAARADFFSAHGSHLSPRAEVALRPWTGSVLKATYTEAFHPPGGFSIGHNDPRAYIASPDLKAETVRSIEASFSQDYGYQRALFGAFRSFWDQAQVFSMLTSEELDQAMQGGQWMGAPTATGAYGFRNAASLEQWGFLASYEAFAKNKNLRFGAQVTRAYSRLDEGKGWGALPVTVSPQLFGNAKISYRIGPPYPTVSLVAAFSGPAPADRAFDGEFEPRPWVSPRASFRLTAVGVLPWVRGLSYRVSANMAVGSDGPYVIGPVQSATAETKSAELSPLERFRVAAALRYDLMQR